MLGRIQVVLNFDYCFTVTKLKFNIKFCFYFRIVVTIKLGQKPCRTLTSWARKLYMALFDGLSQFSSVVFYDR